MRLEKQPNKNKYVKNVFHAFWILLNPLTDAEDADMK